MRSSGLLRYTPPMPTRKKPVSYADAGVDIAAKEEMLSDVEKTIDTGDKRVLSTLDSFATLFDGKFPGYEHPVLVLKTEEPGSKQLIAFRHDRIESVCEDMINHLINDIAVMGAAPLSVQDAVICGKMDKTVVKRIVKACAAACKAQDCVLTGGETSEQPGVIPDGTYILSSSVVGVVDKKSIIDGSAIGSGDVVLAVASNGLHTNGYSLVRRLMQEDPSLEQSPVDGATFLEAILKPHVCYFQAAKGLFKNPALHGMAHITGSGIEGNLSRVLPKNIDAHIDCEKIRILPVFKTIRAAAALGDAEMLKTYNCGVGLTVVASAAEAASIAEHFQKQGHDCYPIGQIVKGSGKVVYQGSLDWK